MIIATVIYEDDERRVIQEVDDADPGYRGERTEWKPGSKQANAQAILQAVLDARQATRDRITAAQATKNAATTAKQMSFTTVAEGRTAFRALCDVVNDLAQEVMDTNRAQLRLLRYTVNDFETPPE